MNEPRLGRREGLRRLVRAACLPVGVLAFLEGEVAALPKGEETDLAVLNAALALEHEAIAIYDFGLRQDLFPAGLRKYAVEFRGDHLGHRDTQVSLAEERGARAVGPLPAYAWGDVRSGDPMLRLALQIERAAQEAYTGLVSQIRSNDYLLSAGFILIDEVRHLTVWRRTLGLTVY